MFIIYIRPMKYLTLLAFSFILLVSCQKKQCWKCHVVDTIDTTVQPPMPDSLAKYDVPVCDKTKKEIRAFESDVMASGRIPYNGGFIEGKFKSVSCD